MEIKEEKISSLQHIYKTVIAAEQIEQKVKDKLLQTGKKVKVPGFRSGKIPLQVLQQRYESTVRPDVLKDILNDTVQRLITEKKLRPAMRPEIKIDSYNEGQSLECTIELEVLPTIAAIDLSKIKCEKLTAEIKDQQIEEQIQKIAENNKITQKLEQPRAAKMGDTLVIDFNGRTLAGPIKGGSGKGVRLELGSGYFIPGFEEQMVGSKPGDEKTVEVTFPKDYQAKELAGQEAKFEVTVHEILETITPNINEDFVKSLGMKDLDALKKVIQTTLEKENHRMTFLLAKKQVLDTLDKIAVELPKSLVEAEFKVIWNEYLNEQQHDHEHCEDDSCEHEAHQKKSSPDSDDAKQKEQYYEIAERRVRLGLILAEIGTQHKVEVTRDELGAALFEHARRYPGQEKKVYEYYQKNPQAMQSLRAPIFEDKVIEVILKEADVKEKKVTQKELEAAIKEIMEGEEE